MTNSYPEKPIVIIPTYNEGDNVADLIPAILATDARLNVLVVDDGSPDNTAGVVIRLKENHFPQRLFLESRSAKLGLGSAYIHGFNWGLAKGHDFLIQMDADWSHHPRYLPSMLQSAETTDFVVGSRYVPGGGTLHWGLGRQMLSRFGNIYSSLILRARFADFTGGFNGWSARTLKEIRLDQLRSNGYSFQIELKYRAHTLGFRHADLPIVFDERQAGKSKMSAGIAFEAFWRVWQLKLFSGRMGR
jgi:dolichol-phosphate mannosyltransferase